MDIHIKYNEHIFKFNLDQELRIGENRIAEHLKNHTRGYAFVAMLHKKLIIKVRDEQKNFNREKYKVLAHLKPNYKTVKEAEANASKSVNLIKLERSILELEEARDVLEVAVRTFEMRKDLIQTLSANIRKERL